MTKLGRLVKENKIKSLEEIYLFSMAIKGRLLLLFEYYDIILPGTDQLN